MNDPAVRPIRAPTPASDRRRRRRVDAAARLAAAVVALAFAAAPPALADSPPDTLTTDGPPDLAAGYLTETEFVRVPPATRALQLAHGYIDPASVTVYVDGRSWSEGRDFRVLGRRGQVVPLRPWSAADGSDALVIVRYRFLPVPVSSRRDLHELVPPPPRQAPTGTSGDADLLEDGAGARRLTGSDLTVRGSKAVRVSSGSRRDLTVDQNLRLSISGQLTDDIRVNAFLSDDNLPVVPEGNTEELRDVDKVLVQLDAPGWNATLGDFVALRSGTVFGGYRRKLQGASFAARPGGFHVEGLAGSPRGRYRTVQFRGEESNQGPYFLGGGDTGANVFIVAGSERVALDGRALTRGADRDYVVDYVRGTITFTYRQLVTAESTIVVEFEEGEGAYSRTVVGGGAGAATDVPLLPGGLARLQVRITEEADDPRRLRTGELSEADEEVLRAAGDDPARAIAPGAVPAAEPGTGQYDRVEEGGRVIYVFAPGGGDWNVSFHHVGRGLGDYDLETLTETGQRVYVFQGDGGGAYRVGRPLPLPERHRLVTMGVVMGDTTGAYLQAEGHASAFERNRLSDLDTGDDAGRAGRVSFSTGRSDLGLGGANLGRGTVAGFLESRDANFEPFLLHKSVFDYAVWGLDQRARREGFLAEAERELGLGAAWETGGGRRGLRLRGDWGRLDRGAALEADRTAAVADWTWAGGRGNSRIAAGSARDRDDPLDIERFAQAHRASWNVVGLAVPAVRFEEERWEDAAGGEGSAAGSRLRRWGGSLSQGPGRRLAWTFDLERSEADSLRAGSWQRARDSRTMRAQVTTPQLAGVRLDASATMRRTERPRLPDETTRLARADLAARWPRLGSDWHLGYGVDNSRAEVLGREIIFVGEGQGDYDAAGDFVGRGQGDFNVVTAGTDSLVATTRVAADLTWTQGFGFLGQERIWGAWTATTRAAVEARSTADEVAPLLRLSRGALFAEEAVLARVTFDEELALLRHLRSWDLRLGYGYVEGRDRQYATTIEDRLDRNWHATVTWSPTARTTLRARGQHQDERRRTDASEFSSRRSYESLVRRLETEVAFRPRGGNRLSLAGEAIDREDAVSGVTQLELAIRPGIRWRWSQRWSVQTDLRVAEVTSEEPAGARRPFFYPLPGRNVEAQLRLGWDASRWVSFSASYFARKRGERRWEHDVRLESTARF
ncbi:MAG: hypothetical protein R6X25_01750 [Candidatus Krumholzibacteriia bacterium]